ncbi:MAG: DUF6880 family protein [Methylocella sp.]
MARQPQLNEEALVKLGSEKLARLVIDEAKRNTAFRKLVAAALAATKGPAAVAAIIDKRLAGLDRAKAFVDWEKAKGFTADIAATLATITGELASAEPDAAVDRLVRFLSTAHRVFERIDDSNGRMQSVYHEAAAALPDLVGRLGEADKASIPDRLFALTVTDDYGFISTIMPELVTHLPVHAVDHWDECLVEAERSLGSTKDWERNWKQRAKADRIIGLRQAIADCRHDVDAFIALEKSRPDGHHRTTAVAERLCDAGRHSEALKWVRKRGRPGLKAMTYDDLADGSSPRDGSDLARTRLEIRILEATGDLTTAQDLRWKTFETTLDIGMLHDHIARLPDFAEFDVLDKAFAHAIGFEQKYRALAFFLNWPRLDFASRLVIHWRAEWEGRHYEVLLAAAETLEPDHPEAATILYRALLDDILNRARSPAYGHAARYLEKLDALAAHGDAASSIDPHHAYRAALSQKHGRKSGFWSLVKVRK